MRVLVVGGGGREHALCWAIAASPLCDKLYCAPGNPGIAESAECVAISADDLAGIVNFAVSNKLWRHLRQRNDKPGDFVVTCTQARSDLV